MHLRLMAHAHTGTDAWAGGSGGGARAGAWLLPKHTASSKYPKGMRLSLNFYI